MTYPGLWARRPSSGGAGAVAAASYRRPPSSEPSSPRAIAPRLARFTEAVPLADLGALLADVGQQGAQVLEV
jgi:hypothetical protein